MDGATETEAVGSVPCPYLPGVGVRAVGLVVPHRPDSPRVRSERLGRCSSGVGERHQRCPFPQPWATVVAPVASEMGRRGKIPLGVCYDQPAHSSAPSVPAGILIYPRKVARPVYLGGHPDGSQQVRRTRRRILGPTVLSSGGDPPSAGPRWPKRSVALAFRCGTKRPAAEASD